MSVTAVARRYAEALADVALARNNVEKIDAELRAFAGMMRESRELHQVFASPVISQEHKRRVLAALVERARPNVMLANLLNTMLSNYRLHLLGEVYTEFRREINERRGIVVAEVTTAAPLEAAEQDRMRERLVEMTGRKVNLQFTTDPSLIAGVITRIGSVVYDGSIRTQLQEIKQRLKEGRV
jgi:F-type H+-transporting ATPase subunit delta